MLCMSEETIFFTNFEGAKRNRDLSLFVVVLYNKPNNYVPQTDNRYSKLTGAYSTYH